MIGHDSLRLSIRHHERTGDALFARPVPQILLLHATAVGAAQWDRLYADDAVFISSTGVTRGRQQVLDRYRSRYPDSAAMGSLTLQVLELRPVRGLETSMVGDTQPGSLHAASVVARWRLSYPEGSDREDAEGLTLLVLHRTADGWRIVHDASM